MVGEWSIAALQAKVDGSSRVTDGCRIQQLADGSAVTQRRWTDLSKSMSIAQRSTPTGDQSLRMKIEGVKRSGKGADVSKDESKVVLLRGKAIDTMFNLINLLESGGATQLPNFGAALISLKKLYLVLTQAAQETKKAARRDGTIDFISREKDMYGDFILHAQQELFKDDPLAQKPYAKPLRNQFDLLHLQASLINDLLCEMEAPDGTFAVDLGGFIATAQLATKSGQVDELSPKPTDIYLWNIAKHDPNGTGDLMAVLGDLAELMGIDAPVVYFHAQPWVASYYKKLNAKEV